MPHCELAPQRVRDAAPLLWRVQRAGGAPLWLYGTIHDAGAGDVPPAVWATLDAAPAVVTELGDGDPDPALLARRARLPWGQVLDHMLAADDWWELVNALLGVVREDDLRHMRPWLALVTLNARMSRPVRPSMDTALVARARARGIAIDRLESWDEQLAALDASVSAADLTRAIHARGAVACELARLHDAYRARDLAELTHTLVDPVRGDALLAARNRRWLPRLETYLAGRGAFVAVGLGHVLGDGGLLALLADAGYSVERAAPGSP